MSDIRRQGKRIALSVTFHGGGAATNLSGKVTDLSQVGLFLATSQFIALCLAVAFHRDFDAAGPPVPVTLEATYQSAWQELPAFWQGVLTGSA